MRDQALRYVKTPNLQSFARRQTLLEDESLPVMAEIFKRLGGQQFIDITSLQLQHQLVNELRSSVVSIRKKTITSSREMGYMPTLRVTFQGSREVVCTPLEDVVEFLTAKGTTPLVYPSLDMPNVPLSLEQILMPTACLPRWLDRGWGAFQGNHLNHRGCWAC